ncbi:MAG: GntR family transcriptional regulator [Planctomycetota bacterium]
MYLPIDTNSGIPIFRQIANALRYYIATGRLAPGEQIPSVRELCAYLQVNPATVNKAFRELELDGWLVTRRGLGTFVASAPPMPSRSEARQVLRKQIVDLVTEAARLGMTLEDLVAAVRYAAEELPKERNVPRG